MECMVKASEEYRSQLRQGPFFKSLARAERPNDLQSIHQLIHQSRELHAGARACAIRSVTIGAISRSLPSTRWRRPIIPTSLSPG